MKKIVYGSGYILIRLPYIPNSTYLLKGDYNSRALPRDYSLSGLRRDERRQRRSQPDVLPGAEYIYIRGTGMNDGTLQY